MLQATLNSRNLKVDRLLRENNRTQFLRVIFLTSIIFSIFILSWIIFYFVESKSKFTLTKLAVTGNLQYTDNEDIRQLILSLEIPNKFTIQDINLIKKQIERLSWIKQVIIKKKWLNKLEIYLIEYIPVAYWNNQLIIDINGNTFNMPDSYMINQKLPVLYGPKGSEKKMLNNVKKMKQILARNKLKLKEVKVTVHHSWQLILTNGIKLNLGRFEIMNRLIRFLDLYPTFIQHAQLYGKRIDYVDLRYSSGAAVGWNSLPA